MSILALYCQYQDNRQLTLYDNVLAIPPVIRRITEERRIANRRVRLICLPVRPALSKVDRVPEHIRTNSLVREREVRAARLERATIIVCVREDHDVVRLALAKQQAANRASCDDATVRRERIREDDNAVGDTSERRILAQSARTRVGDSGLVRVRKRTALHIGNGRVLSDSCLGSKHWKAGRW